MPDYQDPEIIELPDEALPDLASLSGDLRLLAEIVGVRPALRVALILGGGMLYIGKIDAYARRLRDQAMRREFDRRATGETATAVVRDLARKNKLSARQVWTILGSPEPDERQGKLF